MVTEPERTQSTPKWLSPIESRKEKVDYYFETVLDSQRDWYSAKASEQKQLHLLFAMSVIVLGAVISCLQVIDGTEAWVRYVTASMGAAVTVLRSVDTLIHPGETWQSYRKASENMKREYRLYINNADVYSEASDEEAAFRLLVERVETVLAEEQQLYWQFHVKNPASQPTPKPKKETA